MTNAELLAFLFDQPGSATETMLTQWLQSSRRFQAFLVENKAKVRKKLRSVSTTESLQSVLLELEVARYFVEVLRCHVEYEKFGQTRERSPDMTIAFRSRTQFNLEVTRIQMAQAHVEERAEKLARVVCAKIGQCVPNMLNCLLIEMEGGSLTKDEVETAMKSLKRRVEQRDKELISRTDFGDPAGFFKQFQWLNALVLCTSSGTAEDQNMALWSNPQSRIPLPAEIQTLLQKVKLSR